MATAAQPAWAATTVVKRGDILRQIALLMREHRRTIAELVARETGKSRKDALGETDAAIEMGFFVAGEGRRFYGQTTTSAVPNKSAMVIRQPLGVAGLIIAANTPIANVAWKAFPALLCGNAAILKAAEDTPLSAWAFGVLAREAGVPDGVYTTLHGFGEEAGAPLVEHPDVAIVSFTGSCEVGRWIAQTAGRRLAKACLELGGKNPLIVCDDADLQNAVTWTLGSAFSNAGQRCAAGSRIIVFDQVYDTFKQMLVEATQKLKVGTGDGDDFGPVINESQMTTMLASVERAKSSGAVVLTGGHRLTGASVRRRVLRRADTHRACRTGSMRFRGPSCSGRLPVSTASRISRKPWSWPTIRRSGSRHRFIRRVSTVRWRLSDAFSQVWRWSTAVPTAASRTCRSVVCVNRGMAGARPERRRSTSTRI